MNIPGGDNLGVGGLTEHVGHCVGVPGQGVDVHLAAHVPDPGQEVGTLTTGQTLPSGGVAATGHENIQRGVERQVVYCREVAVVVTDHLVVLKVPAFHLGTVRSKKLKLAHQEQQHPCPPAYPLHN